MIEERSAGIIVYRLECGCLHYLLVLSARGHGWGFPKGKMETGEKLLEAALREVEEEVGLSPDALRVNRRFALSEVYTYEREGRRILKQCSYLLAEALTDCCKAGNEQQAILWATWDQAVSKLGFLGRRWVLEAAEDFLTQSENQAGTGQADPE